LATYLQRVSAWFSFFLSNPQVQQKKAILKACKELRGFGLLLSMLHCLVGFIYGALFVYNRLLGQELGTCLC
jgi:hypothetical protein